MGTEFHQNHARAEILIVVSLGMKNTRDQVGELLVRDGLDALGIFEIRIPILVLATYNKANACHLLASDLDSVFIRIRNRISVHVNHGDWFCLLVEFAYGPARSLIRPSIVRRMQLVGMDDFKAFLFQSRL